MKPNSPFQGRPYRRRRRITSERRWPALRRPAHGFLLLLVIPFLTGLAGCDGVADPAPQEESLEPPGSEPSVPELPRALTDGEAEVLEGSNAFGFDLLQEILRETPDSTVFLSPLSASMALGMTMNGAAGELWESMRDALRFGNLSQEEINASYRSLTDLLRGLDPAVTFDLANSIWHVTGLTLTEDFRAVTKEVFDAESHALEFSAPDAADVINAWVEEATRGRIQDMVPSPIPPGIITYLLNATYFQGRWTDAFEPDSTSRGTFHLPDGGEGRADFMTRTGSMLSTSAPLYDAVELPYGEEEAFAMTIVVPRNEATVAQVLEELAGGEWHTLVGNLQRRSARILLPRFELEWEQVLDDFLDRMGMQFGGDLSPMFGEPGPRIEEVKQKTFVRVDEEGTEAAAATSVAIGISGLHEVRADRPFLLAIRERVSGTVLFLAAIVEPPPPAE